DPDAKGYYFMGKDNITFHAQIWPALLMGHNGQGDKGGEPGPYGELNLPGEIVSSEFLTMSGSKFSTSPGTVIYDRDFLREHGTSGDLCLPADIVSREFLSLSGAKFSTTRGTVIYVRDFLRECGPDTLRYYISVTGPENQDTDFTWEEFVRRINVELANEWGNLVNRSISMAAKNNGAIPAPRAVQQADEELKAMARNAFDVVGGHLQRSRLKAAVQEA